MQAGNKSDTSSSIFNRRFWISAAVLLCLSSALHVMRFGRFIEPTIITSYAPGANDPIDYATRAETWALRGDFSDLAVLQPTSWIFRPITPALLDYHNRMVPN